MKIRQFLVVLLLVATSSSWSQAKSKFVPQLNKVLEMFNKKDPEAINAVIFKDYTIGGIFPGMEEQVLPQVLNQTPLFASYTIKSETAEASGTRLKVFFSTKTGEKMDSNFLIANDGKILQLNILENAEVSTEIRKPD